MKKNVEAYIDFRFEKIRLLKKNSKSEVWLALNKSTNQPVILKIINATGLPYAALKEISNPLLAKIFYCAESESDTVIVEEFIAGETLTEKILTDDDARKILLQLCNGLKVLHAQGIIHRDIKPSNLILQSGGNIRLIDFDAARIFKAGQFEDTRYLGTKGYAPPEQFGFGQTDARSDIYSLGKTFLEVTNCGGNLKKILSKCIEVDPKNRYQNVDELQAALTKKNLPFLKICASVAAMVTGFLFFNSTSSKNIPAEIEKVPAVEIPAENKSAPAEIENPVENKSAPAEVETPAPVTGLENFQPSFPTIQQYNFELKMNAQNLGGVQLGDSLETVNEILGAAEEIKTYDGLNFANYFYKNLNLTIENDVVTGITTKNSDVETLKGIRQGDSLKIVLAAYGNHFQKRNLGNTELYIFPYELTRRVNNSFSAELRFTVENNFVTSITLMTAE